MKKNLRPKWAAGKQMAGDQKGRARGRTNEVLAKNAHVLLKGISAGRKISSLRATPKGKK